MQLRKKYIQRKIVKAAETSPNKNKSRNLGKEKLDQNNNQSLYLNKVLQQNLGSQKADSNYPPFRENISNFHSNIQNILSNDERRKKAMKYVIDMRNRKIQISPFYERNNRTRNNDDIGSLNFSSNDNARFKTLNDDLYNSRQRRKIRLDIKKKKDNNILPSYSTNTNVYKKINYGREPLTNEYIIKDNQAESRPYSGFNRYLKNIQAVTPDKRIKVNRINKTFYDLDNNNYAKPMTGRSTSNKNNNDLYNNLTNNYNSYRKSSKYPQTHRQYYYPKRNITDNLDYQNKRDRDNNKLFNREEYFDNEDRDENDDYNYNEYDDDLNEDDNIDNSGMRNNIMIDDDNGNEKIVYKSPKYDEYNQYEYDNSDNYANNDKKK